MLCVEVLHLSFVDADANLQLINLLLHQRGVEVGLTCDV